MDTWGIILLAIDMVIMGGLILVLARGRVPVLGSLIASGADSGTATGAIDSLREELSAELEAARKAAEELELKKRECESYRKDLKEKNSVLTRLIGEARTKAYGHGPAPIGGEGEDGPEPVAEEDLYRKAARMSSMGTSPDKIAESLGMYAGEAELVSSINDFRT